MAVAAHLHIDLAEYDRRIRTFAPYYDEMLDVAASVVAAVARRNPVVVELGAGTGALSARCLTARPDARLVALDSDGGMLAAARRRLARPLRAGAVTLVERDFTSGDLPRSDAIAASLSLHHLHTRAKKASLYARSFDALRRGGVLVTADIHLASQRRMAALDRGAWRTYMRRWYTNRQIDAYWKAWSGEDTYFPLETERSLLAGAGFSVEVVWRRAPSTVLAGWKRAAAPQRVRD
jgi:SAM-dependent methyltransferase